MQVRRLRGGAGPAIVCLPYAGGTALAYARIAAECEGSVEVVAVEREDDAADAGRAPTLAAFAARAAELLAPLLAKPTLLFGHSLGGLLAYAVALELEGRGEALTGVVVSATAPPHRLRTAARGGAGAARDLAERVARIGVALPDAGTDREVRERIDRDLAVLETLDTLPARRLRSPLEIWMGTRDAVAPPVDVSRWRELEPHARIELVSGGHMFVHEQSAFVARRLTAAAGAARPGARRSG